MRKSFFIIALATALMLIAGCGRSNRGEQAARTAKLYYDALLEGKYEEFVDGTYHRDSIRQQYRRELIDNARMFVGQQQEEHRGIREVRVSDFKIDSISSDCSVFYWPKEHYLPKERKVIVPELKSVEDHCREELRSGTKVLRIPLHMTRYKTKVCYMWLDPLKARISRKESPDNGEEGIAIIATNREIAVLKPGDDLYETARDLVGKWIRRVFIERLYEDKEGQVVIVVDNIPDMIKPRV